MKRSSGWFLGMFVGLVFAAQSASADEVRVAVAGNFAGTLEEISAAFHAATGHTLVPSSGASGQLYAQITAGAPFDVFLSADAERPLKLENEGLAVKGSRFVYARGRLVLWSPAPGFVDAAGLLLSRANLGTVAIADPRTAPYGAAAERVLRARGLWDKLEGAGKLALGSSITQAHQFVASGNAVCGFVALSQVVGDDGQIGGSSWVVPSALAGPLDQEAVLLKPAEKSVAAKAFLRFLREDKRARALIAKSGYELPPLSR